MRRPGPPVVRPRCARAVEPWCERRAERGRTAAAEELTADGLGLDSPELAAIGHRVVHGGLKFSAP
ncbi:hypothetical protein ACWGSA_25715, partial [Streptomyces diastaticus]